MAENRSLRNDSNFNFKMSKYKGIDNREIKCCDKSENTIESGISLEHGVSFNENEGRNILNFHFLDYSNGFLYQETKSMWLNEENTKQLIRALQELRF